MSRYKFQSLNIDDRKPPKKEYSGAFSENRYLVCGGQAWDLNKIDIETFRCPRWVQDE